MLLLLLLLLLLMMMMMMMQAMRRRVTAMIFGRSSRDFDGDHITLQKVCGTETYDRR